MTVAAFRAVVKCARCGGTGCDPEPELDMDCQACDGTGLANPSEPPVRTVRPEKGE